MKAFPPNRSEVFFAVVVENVNNIPDSAANFGVFKLLCEEA